MLLSCIPKAVLPAEGCVVARPASQTRPLGLKNTDVKLLASSVARAVNKGLGDAFRCRQHGFLSWRDAVDNIADLDADAQAAAIRA